MTTKRNFEELSKTIHDRSSFDCGHDELNNFIQTQAIKHMQVGISRTMVLSGDMPLLNNKKPIYSFYSVTPSSIKKDTLPDGLAKKLPHYPIPVFLLAQLAVHKDFHGTGLGKISLVNVLNYLWRVNSHMPAYAIIVDCLNHSAQSFYTKYGFKILCEHNGRVRMFLPMRTVGQLFS